MESSHITGDDGGEGCNSSESGWTMYLASPMQGDDDGGGGKGSGSEGSNVDDGYGYTYNINGRRGGKDQYQDDGDDDDSLASDASTGPAKVKVPSMPGGKEDEGHRKHSDDDNGGGEDGKEDEEEDDMHTKFSTNSRKKAGKVEKGGEGKASRRGHSKKGSSSRTSFFW